MANTKQSVVEVRDGPKSFSEDSPKSFSEDSPLFLLLLDAM